MIIVIDLTTGYENIIEYFPSKLYFFALLCKALLKTHNKLNIPQFTEILLPCYRIYCFIDGNWIQYTCSAWLVAVHCIFFWEI